MYTGVQFDFTGDLGGCALAFGASFSGDSSPANAPGRGSCPGTDSTCYGPLAPVTPGVTTDQGSILGADGGLSHRQARPYDHPRRGVAAERADRRRRRLVRGRLHRGERRVLLDRAPGRRAGRCTLLPRNARRPVQKELELWSLPGYQCLRRRGIVGDAVRVRGQFGAGRGCARDLPRKPRAAAGVESAATRVEPLPVVVEPIAAARASAGRGARAGRQAALLLLRPRLRQRGALRSAVGVREPRLRRPSGSRRRPQHLHLRLPDQHGERRPEHRQSVSRHRRRRLEDLFDRRDLPSQLHAEDRALDAQLQPPPHRGRHDLHLLARVVRGLRRAGASFLLGE